MKLTAILLASSIALAQNAASAQTPAPAKPATAAHAAATPHTSTAATHAAASNHACSKLPELSPKIPALPAGASCAKPLYTITTVPAVKITDANPAALPGILETLGLEPTSFSISYIDTKVGSGDLAAPHKWYSVQYTGYLVDGSKFDSSYDHPDHEAFVLQQGQRQVIPGWDTGFYGMHVGGKRRLFIPFQLAYGPTAHGAIPAKAELIFDIELVSQSDEKPAPKTPPTPPPAAAIPSQPAPVAQPASTSSAPSASTPPATPPSATPPTATTPKPQ